MHSISLPRSGYLQCKILHTGYAVQFTTHENAHFDFLLFHYLSDKDFKK
jgi:hypothetical protein